MRTTQRRFWLCALMLALGGSALPPGRAVAAEPVALVTELRGGGRVLPKPSSARDSSAPLELLHELPAGALVVLDRDTRAVLVHTPTQKVYELAGPGRLRVTAAGVTALAGARPTERDVPEAIRAYRLKAVVTSQASLPLRNSAAWSLDGPRGGVLDRAELVWRVRGDITNLTARVADVGGAPVAAVAVDQRRIDLKTVDALRPGAWYVLSVAGEARGKPVTQSARFRLVEDGQASTLAALAPGADASGTDAALYAMALESIGADATAAPFWERVVAIRPR